jgi:hypothetical protein
MIGEMSEYPNAAIRRIQSGNRQSTELTNDDQQRDAREKRPPLHCPSAVLDIIDRPRCAAKQHELDIVNDERHNLQEASGGTR